MSNKEKAELKAKNESEAKEKVKADEIEKMIKFEKVSIFSTLSNDQSFPSYIKKEGKKVSAAKVRTAILIQGGANVANKHRETSKFVETKITHEEFEQLKTHPAFKRMFERGFFSLEKPKGTKKDKSAPLVEKDIEAKNAKVVVTTNTEHPE